MKKPKSKRTSSEQVQTLTAQRMILAKLLGLDADAPHESIKNAVKALRAPRPNPPSYSLLHNALLTIRNELGEWVEGDSAIPATSVSGARKRIRRAHHLANGALDVCKEPSLSDRIRGQQKQGEAHEMAVYMAAEKVVTAYEKASESPKGCTIRSSGKCSERLGQALNDLRALEPETTLVVSKSVRL